MDYKSTLHFNLELIECLNKSLKVSYIESLKSLSLILGEKIDRRLLPEQEDETQLNNHGGTA